MRRNSRVNKFLIPGAQSDTVRDQKGLSVTECDFVTIPSYLIIMVCLNKGSSCMSRESDCRI